MKILKRAQFKIFVLLTALLMALASLCAGAQVLRVSAEDTLEEAEVTYIDTEVERIAFSQIGNNVFFGFELTESDYQELDGMSGYQGDYANHPAYETYEKYLWSLTFWTDFPSMNSEGAQFDQLYAYYSAGWDGTRNPLMKSMFDNTVAHRSTLKRLTYGFAISIPAGTTFPSLRYVKGECEGDVIKYRTTADKAFYYDGNEFVELAYSIAKARSDAEAEVGSVKLSAYPKAEKEEVKALIEKATAEIRLSFTTFSVQDALANFYAELATIMTKNDYQALAAKQTEAKAALAEFFAAYLLLEDKYDEAEWATILAIQKEYESVIDGVTRIENVEAAVTAIQFSVNSVLTSEQKAGLAAYRAAAIERIEKSFVPNFYREAERAQGEALVAAGKAAVEQAGDYAQIDAIEAEYISNVRALKTDAQYKAEEEANKPEPPKQDNNNVQSSDNQESGCNSSLSGISIVLGAAILAVAIRIKKKDGYKDEE